MAEYWLSCLIACLVAAPARRARDASNRPSNCLLGGIGTRRGPPWLSRCPARRARSGGGGSLTRARNRQIVGRTRRVFSWSCGPWQRASRKRGWEMTNQEHAVLVSELRNNLGSILDDYAEGVLSREMISELVTPYALLNIAAMLNERPFDPRRTSG